MMAGAVELVLYSSYYDEYMLMPYIFRMVELGGVTNYGRYY